MNKIKRLGGLSKNQSYYVHEMVKTIIHYAKEGFINGTQQISFLNITLFKTWGNSSESDLFHHIGMYNDIIYTKILKDFKPHKKLVFPKGTIIGSIEADPFPCVNEIEIYKEILDPDNYCAPRYVLDFVNRELNEALSGYNLWTRALDFDFLNIFDLNVLPHMKTY